MTGPARQYRLPLAPLMAAAHVDTHGELADIVRFNRESIRRYAHHGVPLLTADRFACCLGLHPSAIWPEWFEIGVPA